MAIRRKELKAKERIKIGSRGGRGKPRPLRGRTLVLAAHAVLSKWANLSSETHPINVSRLAEALNVRRQAIYNNHLDEVLPEYEVLQKKNSSESEVVLVRRPLEERIASLNKDIAELQSKLDGWIEKWVTVEYNAKMLGIDADKILAPMPPPDRDIIYFGAGGKDDEDDE